MGAVWYRARGELRRRWAGTLVLALLVGLAGGAVLTAVAGARRTDTAFDRFVEFHRTGTAFVEFGEGEDGGESPDPEQIARLPMVAATGRAAYVLMAPSRPDGTPDPDAAGVVNPFLIFPEHGPAVRLLLVEGRAPDQERQPLEISVDERLAEKYGVGPGDIFPMWGYAPEQMEGISTGEHATAPEGPRMDFLVTGVYRAPHDVVAREIDQDVIYAGDAELYVGRAWYERYGDQVAAFGPEGGLDVRLRRGTADVEAFTSAVRRLPGGDGVVIDADSEAARAQGAVRNAIDVQVTALYAFAAIAAAAGILVVGQALGRAFTTEPGDRAVLRALGFSTSTLAGSALVRAAVVSGLGALLAVGLAVAASPLMPIGLSRRAEIDPGISVDGPVLAIGALVIAVVVLARTGLAATADARRSVGASATRAGRTSIVAEQLAHVGAPTSVVSGIRAAFEPGGGRRALSLRTALVAFGLATAAVVAAVGFASSLDRLADSPERQGWAWDATVGNGQEEDPESQARFEAEGVALLERQPVVGDFGRVTDPVQADLDGTRTLVFGISADQPEAFFPLVDGRVPSGPDELAIGRKTMRETGASVGDTVTVAVDDRTRRLRVVGEMAIFDPDVGDELGNGALVTREGRRMLTGQDGAVRRFLVNWADGVTTSEGSAALRRDWGRSVLLPVSATEVQNLRSIGELPFVLAALVAVLALGSLGHALVASVRRRRRELAVLRTVGFLRRQLSASVAWQATTLVLVAMVAGLPLGVAAGRWTWRVVADSLGTAAGPVTPLLAVVLVLPAAVLIANAIAALPARAAARTEPATVLRSE